MFVDMLGWLWHMPINTNMKSVKPTGYGHFAYGYALVSLEAKKTSLASVAFPRSAWVGQKWRACKWHRVGKLRYVPLAWPVPPGVNNCYLQATNPR